MIISPRQALLVTVLYADVFDYPLTIMELKQWMCLHPFPLKIRIPRLSAFSFIPRGKDTYVTLRGRTALVTRRRKRASWSGYKMQKAARVARWLRWITSVRFVGVTGGTAVGNARKEDDIDFYVIASRKTIWITRFLVTVTVEIVCSRRRPSDAFYEDKICLNMYVTDDRLAVAPGERDLFTAHEVLQMVPLWDRDGTYGKFLQANRWVERFLPKAWQEKTQSAIRQLADKTQNHNAKRKSYTYRLSLIAYQFFEPLARTVQLWYMHKRRSTEVVSDKVIRFHPRDARVWIKSALGRRLARFNVPLDKVFYGR